MLLLKVIYSSTFLKEKRHSLVFKREELPSERDSVHRSSIISFVCCLLLRATSPLLCQTSGRSEVPGKFKKCFSGRPNGPAKE